MYPVHRFLLCIACFVPQTLVAGPIDCGDDYVVKRGDTLSGIARAAYGRPSAYQTIFDYNPGVLRDPNLLPIGVRLHIPCTDGREAPDDPPLQALQPAAGGSPSLKIVTGSEYAPYVDKRLPNGGFSVELVERAMQAGGRDADYRIDFINDWGAHLQPLLSEGCYELGFPWFKPDCTQLDRLGEDSAWRCENLDFSEALHEVIITFYARPATAARIATTEDMHGKRICRPQGYFTHDLEAMGLTPPTIIRDKPENPRECFRRLVAGEVDVVTVNAKTSDRLLTELDIRGQVEEMTAFSDKQTLHVVGMKTNPRTRDHLRRIDQGLNALRKNGDYRRIARKHLAGGGG